LDDRDGQGLSLSYAQLDTIKPENGLYRGKQIANSLQIFVGL